MTGGGRRVSHRLDHQGGRQARIVGAFVLAIGCLLVGVAPLRAAAPGSIVVLTAEGEVDGLMADYLADGLAGAADSAAAAVIIRLDTPGGSLAATQEIVTANPGCLLQLKASLRRNGLDMEVRHIVDLLEESYQSGDSTRPS